MGAWERGERGGEGRGVGVGVRGVGVRGVGEGEGVWKRESLLLAW